MSASVSVSFMVKTVTFVRVGRNTAVFTFGERAHACPTLELHRYRALHTWFWAVGKRLCAFLF